VPLEAIHNEKELLIQVAQSDKRAFAKLFYAYHNQLAEFVLLLTESPEMTEEIIQDVFVKIWMKREDLTDIDRFTAYLFILTRNYTLNCIRKKVNDRKLEQQYSRYIGDIGEMQPSHAPQDFSGDPDYQALIGRAIQQLPPQQQKAYLLSRTEGLKYAEIAEQMGLSRETVKKYIQWATQSITEFVKTHKEILSFILLGDYLK